MQIARVFGDHRYTPGQDDLEVLGTMPNLKWMFLGVVDARAVELAKALPRIMVTNGHVCFRATGPLQPAQCYQEVKANCGKVVLRSGWAGPS
jgi:hypothetical protein